MGDVTDEVAREFNLTVTRGAYIVAVVTTDPRNPSPAQRAGIRPGDIVVRWNERDITDGATLTRLVAAATIGSDVEVVIVREGREVTLTVNIDERPLQIN